MGESYKLTEKLYKTADGEVVPTGTGRAVSVYKPAGARIPLAEARELGLIDLEPKKAAKPQDKKRAPVKNKQA